MHLHIPLAIADVKLEKVDTSTTKGIVITVSSTLKGASCQRCGKTIDRFYGVGKEITLRHYRYLKALFGLK
jgi:hypothetical protein